jgi:hypothetical protein
MNSLCLLYDFFRWRHLMSPMAAEVNDPFEAFLRGRFRQWGLTEQWS